jgi:hypothetical protein
VVHFNNQGAMVVNSYDLLNEKVLFKNLKKLTSDVGRLFTWESCMQENLTVFW